MTLRAVDFPFQYEIVSSADDHHQGPLALAPGAAERGRLLLVPSDISPRLVALTRSVVPAKLGPLQRIDAVDAFLLKNNAYSQTIAVGPGDPVSNFVLGHQAGHCEFFGSAAAIMLRIAAVPTRFVIGYYAHETSGNGALVVRAQDAHAWCEAWVDGIGWVTVDATPADGRPDKTAQNAFWWRFQDAAQDLLVWIRLHAGLDQGTVRGASVGLLVLLAAVLAVRWFAKGRRPRARVRRSAPVDRTLAIFATRFSALLARRKMACPEGLTWAEHAASIPFDEASAFIEGYNRARFGNGAAIDPHLDELLTLLEKEPT